MKARVMWEIDVEVDGGVHECALDALEAISGEGSIAKVFIVDPEGDEATPKEVDFFEGTIKDWIPTCSLDIRDMDEAANPVESTTQTQLSLAALADIVSHARQLAILSNGPVLQDAQTKSCLAELTEAVEAAGLC